MIAAFVVPQEKPKKKYIDLDVAINAVYEAYANGESAYDALESIPPADVRPLVRGKWETPNAETTLCTCSVCGKVAPYDVEADTIMYWPSLNYCPNCGAKMEES